MSTSSRLTGLDGLRGFAAAAIVVLHVWMYTGAHDPGHSVFLDAVIGELRIGLICFFVLSGFLLARPWARAACEGTRPPRLGRYALQRAARIAPAYWVALAGAFLVLAGTGHPREADAGALPVFALFAQNQFDATAGQLDPPTWSLGVEVGFYLLLPLAGWAFVRAGTRRRALAVCGAMGAVGLAWCLVAELERWPATVTTSPLTYLPVFACGIAAALVAHGRSIARREAWLLGAAGWGLVIANGAWHSAGTGLTGHVVRDLPAAAGFAMVALAVSARPARVLDSRPVRWIGTVSYGTYLWHMPVLYWLVTRELFPESPLWACLAVLGPSLALGAMSWIAVERPVLRWAAAASRPARGAPRREALAGSRA